MNNTYGIMRFFNNKYVFLAVNCVLFIAAVISLFGLGTVQKASSLLELTMPDKVDLMIVSVYVIIAVFSAVGIFLAVKALTAQNNDKAMFYMCGGTLLFTAVHVISAHFLSLALIMALVKEKIGVSEIVAGCPVLEMFFLSVGIIFLILNLTLTKLNKNKPYLN